jgi:prephenate dehydrogenase
MPLLGQDLSRALSLKVAILGPGLIGGSLAMSLARTPDRFHVSVWARRNTAAIEAQSILTGCHVVSNLAEALEHCDIAVLCMSPHAIEESAKSIASLLPKAAVVSDAGSVKARIVAAMENVMGDRFIGAHPMAGSEQHGILAARHDLYSGALCILTPTPLTGARAHDLATQVWRAAGCSLREMSPQDHDAALARVSHLPHATASALVRASISHDPSLAALSGGGFRDSTRIASGPAPMWSEILIDNRDALIGGINDLQNELQVLKVALENNDRGAVEQYLSEAAQLRTGTPF